MLERNSSGKFAKSIFYDEINDIDIYVEDTAKGYEKLLTTIFSRALKHKYNVETVFPLGSRINVHNKYLQNISSITRPTLYVVDGDLYLMTGDTIDKNRGIYVFPFYCFENIICQEQSILEILNEEDCVKNIHQIMNDYNYPAWYERNGQLLHKLFIEYAIIKRLKPTIPTVSFDIKKLTADGFGNLSIEKVKKRTDELKNILINEFGQEAYDSIRVETINCIEENEYEQLDVVSGKDYIFPLLKTRARSTVKTNITDITFKLRLTSKINLDKIKDIENYIALPA